VLARAHSSTLLFKCRRPSVETTPSDQRRNCWLFFHSTVALLGRPSEKPSDVEQQADGHGDGSVPERLCWR